MAIGIIGKKRGMTRVFTEDGRSIPVTVIQAKANRVVRLRSLEEDGYQAVQVAWGTEKPKKINKPMTGIYTKANIESGEGLTEFRVDGIRKVPAENGEITVDDFTIGQKVDISGTTIGKGYSGVIKRHNFRHQRNSHGTPEPIVLLVLLVSVKHPAGFSKVRKWPVKWVIRREQFRILKS